MLAVSYTVTFAGVDVCANYGCFLSKFEETPPEPKLHTVDIPAGDDIDITEALGAVAFHNGKHHFVFAFAGDDVVDCVRRFSAFVHGTRADYSLSWDAGYTYTGRWTITDIEHVNPTCYLVTIEVSRTPWKIVHDSVILNAHPSASYTLEGSVRYSDVTVNLLQGGTVYLDGELVGTYAAGTQLLFPQLSDDGEIMIVVDDWYYYVDDTDLIVNPDYYTQSGANVDLDNTVFTVNGTNIECPNAAKQTIELTFTRKDF